MATATTTVHWTQPNLTALSETDGHGDTCGPIVMLDCRHLAHGVPLDIATLDASRAELIRWGLMNTPGEAGMTITQIATALRDHYQITPAKVVEYGGDMSQFHSDIQQIGATHQLVIMETDNAAALPDNQSGVINHFILIGGIDSSLGYWVCNGDTNTALRHGGTVPPVWYSWGNLAASKPNGYIILPALDIAPPPPPPPPEDENIAGALADLHTAIQALTDAVTKLGG